MLNSRSIFSGNKRSYHKCWSHNLNTCVNIYSLNTCEHWIITFQLVLFKFTPNFQFKLSLPYALHTNTQWNRIALPFALKRSQYMHTKIEAVKKSIWVWRIEIDTHKLKGKFTLWTLWYYNMWRGIGWATKKSTSSTPFCIIRSHSVVIDVPWVFCAVFVHSVFVPIERWVYGALPQVEVYYKIEHK